MSLVVRETGTMPKMYLTEIPVLFIVSLENVFQAEIFFFFMENVFRKEELWFP